MTNHQPRPVLVLFPGAGSSSDHSSLRRIEAEVAPAWRTVRADFDYRLEGRRAPDRPPKLMEAVRRSIGRLRGDLVLGGRSMGGRICSMVATGADGLDPPARLRGLVLISYPLHPPGRPERLRVEHLPEITVPCLFVSGTKDTFGSPGELERWTETITAPVTHHWIDGRGHDLKGADDEIAGTVAAWLEAREAG